MAILGGACETTPRIDRGVVPHGETGEKSELPADRLTGGAAADDLPRPEFPGEETIRLDVGGEHRDPGGGFVPCDAADAACACNGLDVLFVVDNSTSMQPYQDALALAFPAFAATLDDSLPAGTTVHIGVTSTEMGHSSMGTNTGVDGVCQFIGDGGLPHDAFYVTPDDMHTGVNGTQGRLYDPGGRTPYYEFVTGGDLDGARAWFRGAVNIGEGGSNIEMSSAPVGWVIDPANDATNAGFLRDAGAVFAVFFIQDEPDQSPNMIDGVPTSDWLLQRVADAKSACGGLDCVVGGGYLAETLCNATGERPVDGFLAGLPTEPAVTRFSSLSDPLESALDRDNPQQLAEELTTLLSQTLSGLIRQTCEEIAPVG